MSKELRDRLLLQAARHIRSRGYAAFSYADLSRENGVSKATVHHYFRTKEELGAALLADHQERFAAHLAGLLEGSLQSSERLRAYGDLFREGFSDGMLPLCGALAAERDALPESLREGARRLFEAQLRWLEAVLDQGAARRLRSWSRLLGCEDEDWRAGDQAAASNAGKVKALLTAPTSCRALRSRGFPVDCAQQP